MKFRVITFGCRLNSLESEGIADYFIKSGWENTNNDIADLYIFNTCTVTAKADQKARRLIRKYANIAPVIVSGCYAEIAQQEIEKISRNIVVIKGSQKQQIPLIAKKLLSIESSITAQQIKNELNLLDNNNDRFIYEPGKFLEHSRASLKIQDGCNASCKFCVVHIARGKSVSLDSNEVFKRCQNLLNKGYKEICLTGVNLTQYNYNNCDLGNLIKKLKPLFLDSNAYIRFSSIEISMLGLSFYDIIGEKFIAPHFHFPLQSLSDKIISSVGRNYTADFVRQKLDLIRNSVPRVAFGADIITGLPSESDEDFKTTYEFLKNEGFSYLHVFPFSPRKGTPLFNAKNKVPERVRDERAQILRELSDELHKNYISKFEGKLLRAIAQKKDKDGRIAFTTDNYIQGFASFSNKNLKEGELVNIRVKKSPDIFEVAD